MRRLLTAVLLTVAVVAAAATTAQALSRSARITTAGLGPVKIGMTEKQVERALKRPIAVRASGNGSCGSARMGRRLFGLFSGRRLARVYVGSTRYATRSGIRVGDSEQAVLDTYRGEVVREPHAYDPQGSYLKIVDGNRKVVFDTDGRRVTQISTGRRPEIDYVEGCA